MFRLPTKEGRKTMTIEQLENTVQQYEKWYLYNEENFTESQANKAWKKRNELMSYIEQRKEEKTMEKRRLTIYKDCNICGGYAHITFNCTENEYLDYKFNYETIKLKPIQEIFPNLRKNQREFLSSGICTKCQKEIF